MVLGIPYHVTQRGNPREDMFLDDADPESQPASMKTRSERYGLQAHGFRLMSNRVHLVAMQARYESTV